MRADPDLVARHADYPISEVDLHARHLYLVNGGKARCNVLMADPDAYDAKLAGWWVWGICQWIGGGWCSGSGPWTAETIADGELIRTHQKKPGLARGSERGIHANGGVKKRKPSLDADRGIHAKKPTLTPSGPTGVHAKKPALTKPQGIGVHASGIGIQKPALATAYACGVHSANMGLSETPTAEARYEGIRLMLQRLSDRLRMTRIMCGDWQRILTPSVTTNHGVTGVLLDPPYPDGTSGLYSSDTGKQVAYQAEDWAKQHANDPAFRIAFCGYDGLHTFGEEWAAYRWKANGGYGNQAEGSGRENSHRECIWLSPHCLNQTYTGLLAALAEEEDPGE